MFDREDMMALWECGFPMMFGLACYALIKVSPFVVAGLQRLQRRQPTPSTTDPDLGPDYQKYGHPRAPVPALYAALPDPPANYVWEIKVEPDKKDHPSLVLTMVDVRTSQPVDTRRVCLILEYEHIGVHWAESYRKHDPKYIFRNDLIIPFISWAQKLVDTHTMYETSGEYMMKTRDDR